MTTAIRLRNGRYRLGRRVYSFRRVQLAAFHRGFRFLHIVEHGTGTHVDTIDLV